MKRYHDYMDGVEVSDTLHEKLKNLEEPKKKPQPWAKWGAAAAALVLIAGVGAWGLSRFARDDGSGETVDLPAIATAGPDRENMPVPGANIADIPAPDPDIAPANPDDPYTPADRTNGGYEVTDGKMTAYFFLPALDWTDASAQPQASLDYSLAPPDAIQRDATWDDILLFMGGEKAMADHLLWDGFTWGGTLWFLKDGTPCGASFSSDWVDGTHLYLEVRKGHEVPSCVVLPDEYYETSQWQGVEITAVKNGGYAVINGVELNEKREVSLYSNGTGYKLTLYANDVGRADEMCARFVRYAVDGGFSLSILPFQAGDLPNKGLPPEDAPGAGILYPSDPGYIEPFPTPNGMPDEASDGRYPDCPYCADGSVHTHPYDPSVPAATPYSPAN